MLSTDVIRNGRKLVATPLPLSCFKKDRRKRPTHLRLEPKWVLVPNTKLKLAPHGVVEPKQVILAAEVASQISHEILVGKSRVKPVVHWRWATYLALLDMVPSMSRCRAAYCLHRDHTTMLHAEAMYEAQPELLDEKIAAIKEVLE
jgi:hypothetical protein